MGIVLKQSFNNTLILFLGFAIGAINVLFLYTHFLHEDYFGLITFLLSTANIMLPLMVFGMQHTVVKFFSSYKNKEDQDSFLVTSVLLPLLIIIPVGLIGITSYETISNWISKENPLIKNYTYLIFILAIFMGYFEVFYAWSKVQMQSVFGNFIKEIFARVCVTFLLIAVYYQWISNHQFIYAVVIVYIVRAFLMEIYAMWIYIPKIVFKLPNNLREIVSFSFYMIVAGSAGGILLEIDKFMIPQIENIAEVAYYGVGVYIASVIGVPTRAMQQITTPITAKDLNNNDLSEVEGLYKRSSITLLVVGGLFFLLINLNINDLYNLINKPEFTKGIWIVFIISIAKLYELALGTGNAILVNSKFYKVFFYLSIAMALTVVFLNNWLINLMGINGAAFATLIVVLIYNTIKILYVNEKLKMNPFGKKTIYLMITIIVLYIVFNFINFTFHPLVNIILKSFLITAFYIVIIKVMKISSDVNELILKYFKK